MDSRQSVCIGDDGCKFHDVVNAIRDCPAHLELRKDPTKLINILNLEADVFDLERAQTFDLILTAVLKAWRSTFSNEATLEKFISILRNADFTSAADCLQKKFRFILPTASDQMSSDRSNMNATSGKAAEVVFFTAPDVGEKVIISSSHGSQSQQISNADALRDKNEQSTSAVVDKITEKDNNDSVESIQEPEDVERQGVKQEIPEGETDENTRLNRSQEGVDREIVVRGTYETTRFNSSQEACHLHIAGYLKTDPIKFICCIFILLLLIIGVIIGLVNYFGINEKPSKMEAEDIPSGGMNISSESTNVMIIDNYYVYNEQVVKSSNKTNNNLHIRLNSNADWPSENVTSSSTYVTNLTFFVADSSAQWTATVLHTILQSCPNLRELTITAVHNSNSNNELPRHHELEKPLYAFGKLKVLNFKNMSKELLQLAWNITDSYQMNYLVNVSLTEGILDDDNVNFIPRILLKLHSLRRLDIKALVITDKPLFKQVMSSNKLTEIHLDWKRSNGTSTRVYHFQSRDIKLCDSFPNLRIFKSPFGILPISDIVHCKKLETLIVAVDGDASYLNLSSIPENLDNLKEIAIYLHFSAYQCPLSNEMIKTIQDAFDNFKNLDGRLDAGTFRSNCVIKPPDQTYIGFQNKN